MFHLVNLQTENKEAAQRSFSVKFQGNNFHPCVGLMHWLRWGKFVFDVRPLRKYLGLPPEAKEFYIKNDKSTFEARIKEIIDAAGEQSFFVLNAKVNEMINEKNKQAAEEANKNKLPFDAGLGF